MPSIFFNVPLTKESSFYFIWPDKWKHEKTNKDRSRKVGAYPQNPPILADFNSQFTGYFTVEQPNSSFLKGSLCCNGVRLSLYPVWACVDAVSRASVLVEWQTHWVMSWSLGSSSVRVRWVSLCGLEKVVCHHPVNVMSAWDYMAGVNLRTLRVHSANTLIRRRNTIEMVSL